MRRFVIVLLALPLFGCARTVTDVVTKMQWDATKGDLRVTSCRLEQDGFNNHVDVGEDGDTPACKTTTMHLADPNPNGGPAVGTPTSPK